MKEGRRGQFEVLVDGETLVARGGNWLTRQFGAGYPSQEEAIAQLESRLGSAGQE